MRLPTAPYLRTVRIKNFKAIRDSGPVRLTPLTVLIGNNGSGKSSLIEALETLHLIALDGLDAAMNRWKGIEHATNKLAKQAADTTAPISFYINGMLTAMRVGTGGEYVDKLIPAAGQIVVAADRSLRRLRVIDQWFQPRGGPKYGFEPLSRQPALLYPNFGHGIFRWQFLFTDPGAMGEPQPPSSSEVDLFLTRDAANIAAYLKVIYETDRDTFEGIVEAMKFVVPYAKSFNYEQTGDLIRSDYLTLTESDFKIPGWMISTGTLRVLAILACLRHPYPPHLLVIEELENGLDPRTLGLVLSEIDSAVKSGRTQVIVTTHSPYLLDQIPLESIVTVQREDGQPTFKRPLDIDGLAEWRERFSPGQLYTMGRFRVGLG